jgi:hypothetical protein
MSQLELFLWLTSIFLTLTLVVRLWREGLHRIYLCFFVYLLASLAQSLLVLPLEPNSKPYAVLYFATQPLIWLLFILIVLELYSLVLRNHPGIATVGRWTLSVALGFSIVISLVTLLPDVQKATGPGAVLICYTVIERGVLSSLVVFLLVITGFLLWYPLPLSRNVILHVLVYCCYFLSSTTALFVRNITGLALTRTVSTVLIGIANACLAVWIVFLSRAGERKTVVVGHQWSTGEEDRLVQQLDSINAALLKVARK